MKTRSHSKDDYFSKLWSFSLTSFFFLQNHENYIYCLKFFVSNSQFRKVASSQLCHPNSLISIVHRETGLTAKDVY